MKKLLLIILVIGLFSNCENNQQTNGFENENIACPVTTQLNSTVYFLSDDEKKLPNQLKEERLNIFVEAWQQLNPNKKIHNIKLDPKLNWVEIYEK